MKRLDNSNIVPVPSGGNDISIHPHSGWDVISTRNNYFNSELYANKINFNYYKYDILDLFNKKAEENKIKLDEKKYYLLHNIIEERVNDIKSRKIFNKILNPNYFFTSFYNDKSSLAQNRH
jgi:hypothetical protein